VALKGLQRLLLVVAYTVIFWVALPALLWYGARWGDGALAWSSTPQAWAWTIVATGAVLLGWAWYTLWRDGGGLPVSALPPPRLATRGPYRFVRHPNYLGFNLGLLGVGLVAGSPTLAWIASPVFLLLWIGYATIEERGLLRRFGGAYGRYRRRVGLLPRAPVYPLLQLAMKLQLLPTQIHGREHIPRTGPAVLIANHACYVDFLFVGAATSRQVRFVTTAEIFRKPLVRWLLRRVTAVPLRRYRPDVGATLEIRELLREGELVGIFPEGERAPLGNLQPSLPAAAKLLARVDCPVIPVGISGNYDVGPRWADRLRRHTVTVRVGAPVELKEGDPAAQIDAALRRLMGADPQPVDLSRLDRERLGRVVWACPRCRDEDRWRAARLRCDACGSRWRPTAEGWFTDDDGHRCSLAELAEPLWSDPGEAVLRGPARGWVDRDGERFRALQPLGPAQLEIGPEALRFQDLTVPLERIQGVTTERADTLQVSTAEHLWQFRPERHSAFRLHLALNHWRGRSDRERAREESS
jgi:1-acyl-sn-glycerol-3-phosphate acyltransferase